jgi:drug/metabolite transporter (DMT)-like permease
MASTNPRGRGARRAIFWLVAAAACWGLDTTLSAYALQQLQPPDLFVAETVVGAVAVWGALRWTGSYRRPARLRPHLLLGIAEPGVAYLFFDLGLRRTSATSAGLLTSTETLLAVALAVIVLGERLRPLAVGALVAGVAGTVAVSASSGGGHATLIGNLLVLAGSLTAGSYYLIARRLPIGDDALTGTGFQVLAAAGIALAYAAFAWPTHGSGLARASAVHLLVAAITGIVGIAVPYFLLNRALAVVPASAAALTLNLVPVFAVASAVALLGEALMILTIVGGALILSSLVVVSTTPEVEITDPG